MAAAHLQTHDIGTATRGLLRIETTTNSPQLLRPVGAMAPISGPEDPDDDRESDVGEASLGDGNVGGLPGVAACISDPLTSRTACVQTPVVPGSGPNSWTATGQDTSLGTIAGFRAQEPHVHTPPASIALASGCSVWPDKSRVLPQAGSTDHPTHPSSVEPNIFSSSSADDHSAGNVTVVRNRTADQASAILGSPIREPTRESQPSALGSGNAIYGTSLCDTDHSINKSLPISHLSRRSSTCSVAETAACNSAPGAAQSSSPTPVVSPPNSREERDRSHGFQVATPLLHGGRPSDRHRAPSSVFSIKSGIMGRDEDGAFQRAKTHPLVGTAQLRKTQHDLEEELRCLTLQNRQHISTSESAVPSLPAQKPVGCVDPVEPSTCTGAATGVGTAHFEALDQSTPAGEPEDILGHSPSLHSPSSRSTESGASDGMTHVSLVDRIRGEFKVIAGKAKRDPAKIAQGRALMSGDH